MSAIYVINGFYMAMREKFTKADAKLSYFVTEWDSGDLSWEEFRGQVLGATDPSTAAAGSLRKSILDQWKALGLPAQPTIGENGVHASASPFEALAERMNWLGIELKDDEFGRAMLAAGVPEATIKEWCNDPQVEFEGKKQSLFDLLEDLNVADCLKKCQAIAGVEGSVSATKNQAFVFIKPHAVTPAAIQLVKGKFTKEGISVVGEGTLEGPVIEAKKLIDIHYGAIANKASLSKPAELNPPAAKQEDFAKKFGITWADALAKGLVYNAVDACAHFGCDGEAMDTTWAKSKKSDQLIKFGGGFYCGLVNPPSAAPASDEMYVINGFYMSMREKFTKPGASISYYLVQWDPASLSWEDFRGRVLGGTDPSCAEIGSLRHTILAKWKELGLSSEPNVGDNGVHASASPFEALAERMNWVSAKLGGDDFGKLMLGAGIPEETVMAWTKDPQVEFEGKKQSLFDLLEDLNVDECLTKAQAIAGVTGEVPAGARNQAFVFVKPHAVTKAVDDLVRDKLQAEGIAIMGAGTLGASVIESKKLIDNHYYAIANKASLSKPAELNPPAAKQEDFAKQFGLSWTDALAKGVVYNAVDACEKLGISGDDMDKKWAVAKKAGQLIKFGGGFYCGQLSQPKAAPAATTGDVYVINGFYMSMREKYTKPRASINYFLAEWEAASLSWSDFRGKVLGGTDPTTAETGSLRRVVLDQWKELGLTSEPNVGDNGVHASASPFEALAERMNWTGAKLTNDEFGKAMHAAKVPVSKIMAWTKDPQVEFEGGKASLFDLLEDLDGADCLKKCQAIAGVDSPVSYTKNQAFVFIKPHAVTPAVVKLVKDTFASQGITIVGEGVLDNTTIESKKLIDNHYYAIANKASLSKPAELNPPAAKQEEFAKLFGFSWADALAKGVVYNAVDGCSQLGIDGDEMDKRWAATKKAGKLVKFGGGFYCGLVAR